MINSTMRIIWLLLILMVIQVWAILVITELWTWLMVMSRVKTISLSLFVMRVVHLLHVLKLLLNRNVWRMRTLYKFQINSDRASSFINKAFTCDIWNILYMILIIGPVLMRHLILLTLNRFTTWSIHSHNVAT